MQLNQQKFRSIVVRMMFTVALLPFLCSGQEDFRTAHCGKKFRILTHDHPPFIFVDSTLCINQKCPPEAFGEDGGLTYNFVMNDVLRYLKLYCQEENAPDPNVEFEWYLAPTEDKTSAKTIINMLCRGKFDSAEAGTQGTSQEMQVCPSTSDYKGPSPVGTCDYAYGDRTCVSTGADIAVGGIHVLREYLDMVDFSLPYITESQVIVKRPDPLFTFSVSRLLTIFSPFTGLLWMTIIIEVLVVWVLIMLTEAGVIGHLLSTGETVKITRTKRKRKAGESLRNVSIAGGIHAIYDSFFWSMGSAFDPGGPGESPTTVSGRFIMLAHWFFLVVMAATYTGAVGPFLANTADLDIIESFKDLKSGKFSVVVRGPTWDDHHPNPDYLGTYGGGNSDSREPQSTQTAMKNDFSSNFNIYTTKNMHSFVGDQRIVMTPDNSPCTIENARLGAFDMVLCKSGDDVSEPESLIYDAHAVIYELKQRKAVDGKCNLLTAGSFFNPSGLGFAFPKNTTFPQIFSRAIERARSGGTVEAYKAKYSIRDEDNECFDDPPAGGLVMTIAILSGLFVITGGVVIIALLMGFVFRVIWPIFCTKLDEEALAETKALEQAQEGGGDEEDEEEDPDKKTMNLLNTAYEDSTRLEELSEGLAESARRAEQRAEDLLKTQSLLGAATKHAKTSTAPTASFSVDEKQEIAGDLVYMTPQQ